MISLKEFMEVVDYRITEGSDYTWNCFGEDARPYSLSAWNGDHDGWSFNITFDTKTQDVYVVEACDYKNQRAYRIINPLFKADHDEFASVEYPEHKDQAWDDVDYIDLEVEDDWLEKARAIVNGQDYDDRVKVPIDFSDDELLKYMKMAHDRDMTFNAFVEEALRQALEDFKRDPEGMTQRAKDFVRG